MDTAQPPRNADGAMLDAGRDNCYRCHKAKRTCVCESIDRFGPIDNRTEVLVIQHPREQRHPIGSLRFARLGLRNCRVEVAQADDAGRMVAQIDLPPGAALLYPSAESRDLTALQTRDQPSTLVLLDGTWSTVRRLLDGDPRLTQLPKVCLTPKVEGRYRIRREPRAECMSTLEAMLAALEAIEPDRAAQWQALLGAFDEMIDRQIEIVDRVGQPRRRAPRSPQQFRAVPPSLGLEHGPIVCVNIESTQINNIDEVSPKARRQIVRLSALRLAKTDTDQHQEAHAGDRLECFDQIVRVEGRAPSEKQMRLMGTDREQIQRGCTQQELAAAWADFMRPEDRLAAWNQLTLDLLPQTADARTRLQFVLKGIYANLRRRRAGALEATCVREGLQVTGMQSSRRSLKPLSKEPAQVGEAMPRGLIRAYASAAICRWLGERRDWRDAPEPST